MRSGVLAETRGEAESRAMEAMDYLELHRDALVIDCHNDTIVAHIRGGNVSLEPERRGEAPAPPDLGGAALRPGERHPGTIAWLRGPGPLPPGGAGFQVDFPKLRQGDVAVGFRLAGPALSTLHIHGTLHIHDNSGARDEQVTILRALGLSRQAEGAMG